MRHSFITRKNKNNQKIRNPRFHQIPPDSALITCRVFPSATFDGQPSCPPPMDGGGQATHDGGRQNFAECARKSPCPPSGETLSYLYVSIWAYISRYIVGGPIKGTGGGPIKGTGGVQGQIFGMNLCCRPGYGGPGTFYGIEKSCCLAEIWLVKVGPYARDFGNLTIFV